ncbi:MAG TPA: AAA family ATPase, partial [Thermoanaerobaculia bacterium]|nr:AAA family ATPase [Thermoanaerobaculia bacterium]
MSEALRKPRQYDDLDDTDIRSVPLLEGGTAALIEKPFVGLRPFDVEDGHLFFGRREQTRELLERLQRTRLVAAVGGSGCGKSSLVRAGLIPALDAGFLVADRTEWEVVTMKPGERPLHSLAVELLPEGSSAGLIEEQTERLRDYGANAVIECLRPTLDRNKNVLLVVDQFEEVFRYGLCANEESQEDAATFVATLLALIQRVKLPVYVVLTMRLDFISDCGVYPGFAEAMNRSIYLVPRLSRQQRREAILGPIRMAGASMDPRLLDALLNESDLESDQLPVLQHALMRTWEEWRKDVSALDVGVQTPPVSLAQYEHAGTLRDALSLHAEEALEGLDLEITERLFRALTDTDFSNRQIRRPARLSDLENITKAPRDTAFGILDRFRSDGRCFVVFSCEPAEGDPVIDISHESLIRNWDRLRKWVTEEADSAANYRRLEEATALYRQGKAGLWGDPQLQFALDWRGANPINRDWAQRVRRSDFFQITQWERPGFDQVLQFLEKSRAHRDEAKEGELRAQRERLAQAQKMASTRKVWASIAFGCAMVAVILAAVTLYLLNLSKNLNKTLLYSKLTQQSKAIALSSPQKSVLLAVEALEQGHERDAEGALRYALTALGGRGFGVHLADISSLAISPDGRWVVAGSSDGAALRWDLVPQGTGPKPVELTTARAGKPHHPAFVAAARNQLTAVGSIDGSVRVSGWDVPVIPSNNVEISALSLTPDGRFLVAGNVQGDLRLCDLHQKPRPVPVLLPRWHDSRIVSAEIIPASLRLITRDGNNRMAIWDLRQDPPRRIGDQDKVGVSAVAWHEGSLAIGNVDGHIDLKGHRLTSGSLRRDVPIVSVALGPHYVAAVNAEGQVALWNRQDGQQREYAIPPVWSGVDEASPERVVSLKISVDGRWLAGASSGNEIFLWRFSSGGAPEDPFVLRGHEGPVRHYEFTPDGNWLITGGADGTLRRWDLTLPDPSNEALRHRAEDQDLQLFALSPTHRWLLTGNLQGVNLLNDLSAPGATPVRLPVDSVLYGAKVSSDDHWLVTGSQNQNGTPRVLLWNLMADTERQQPVELPGISAFDLSADPEGDWLITAGTDGSASVRQLGPQGLAQPIVQLPPQEGRARTVAMTPNGQFLLVLVDGAPPRLWNRKKRTSTALEGLDVSSVAISPDSRWLVLSEQGGALRAWDLKENPPRPLTVPGANGSRALVFDRDGRLICGGQQGRVSIYR